MICIYPLSRQICTTYYSYFPLREWFCIIQHKICVSKSLAQLLCFFSHASGGVTAKATLVWVPNFLSICSMSIGNSTSHINLVLMARNGTLQIALFHSFSNFSSALIAFLLQRVYISENVAFRFTCRKTWGMQSEAEKRNVPFNVKGSPTKTNLSHPSYLLKTGSPYKNVIYNTKCSFIFFDFF